MTKSASLPGEVLAAVQERGENDDPEGAQGGNARWGFSGERRESSSSLVPRARPRPRNPTAPLKLSEIASLRGRARRTSTRTTRGHPPRMAESILAVVEFSGQNDDCSISGSFPRLRDHSDFVISSRRMVFPSGSITAALKSFPFSVDTKSVVFGPSEAISFRRVFMPSQ
jgi:hypothetical protein